MKKIIFLLLLTIGLFHSSCKKDPFKDKTVIEGYILEYGSEKPLPDVRIYLQRLDGPANGPYTWVVLDSIFTDENGYVHYEFNHNEVTVDKCTFKTPSGYYPIKEHAPNLRKANDISRLVDPYSWIEFHIKNELSQGVYKEIGIAGPWGGGALDDFFYGQNVDETVYRQVRGNQDCRLQWTIFGVNNNLLEGPYRDTIYVPAHDTLQYEIFY